MSPEREPRDVRERRPGTPRRWRDVHRPEPGARPRRSLVLALVLASASLMTLDASGGHTVVDPVRRVLGEVLGPVEAGTTSAVRPFLALPEVLRSRDGMREDIGELQAENSRLRSQVATAGYDRNKLAQFEGLTAAADDLGYALVPARVVGLGPSQSFSHTVTIDAGSTAGLTPDMTVLNNDGLVGRVVRVTRSTATVLLAIDADSTVGGRVGESMDMGFLRGRGEIGREGRLDLELIDQAVVPARDDSVVTWGSEGGAPYVSGVPVGRVVSVYSSLRETAQRAVIEPYVDFATLDVVGVVVPSGTRSDRSVIEADGSLR